MTNLPLSPVSFPKHNSNNKATPSIYFSVGSFSIAYCNALSQDHCQLMKPTHSTSAPILECYYNIHKSNNTYISDLDVSRTHLVSLICSPGLAGHRKRIAAGEETDRLNIVLGGVACFSQRDIKPYEQYEMCTRVLSLDQKWVYVVTYYVKKGAVAPAGYIYVP